MKGNEEVISVLNEVLTSELTAINQYFIHSKMCEDWGFQKLAAKKRGESIEEMQHAQEVIDRILELTGSKPYQVQRLCVTLVNRMYEKGRRVVTIDDVDAVARDE